MTHEERPGTDEQRPSVSRVFWAFLRMGVTAFGGPAMVAFIREMAVTKNGWLSKQSFQEGVAVAQTIPGATAMQTAAYVGLRLRGVPGAAAAYIGFGLPAFCLMLALSAFYSASQHSPISVSVFKGLQVAVVAIVARAAYTFGRSTMKGLWDGVIALAAAAYIIVGGNPAWTILAGAAVGLVVYKRAVAQVAEGHPDTTDLRSATRQGIALIVVGAVLLAILFFVNRQLFDLAALMLKVDALAFGGGFASVPVMLHSVAEVNGWMTTRAFMDGIAMGQVTPGPIVITATFVGFHVAGALGALVATVAVFFPSFVILVLVVPRFDHLKKNPHFQCAIRGVLASFVGLLLAVTVKLAIAAPWSPWSAIIGGAAFVALMLGVSVPWVMIPCAVLSAFLLH